MKISRHGQAASSFSLEFPSFIPNYGVPPFPLDPAAVVLLTLVKKRVHAVYLLADFHSSAAQRCLSAKYLSLPDRNKEANKK